MTDNIGELGMPEKINTTGLGVLLVIVVGVGWKCTPRGHEPLHALFGIGSFMQGQSRGRRHRRHRNRDRSWFGGMMYPEFQFRRPPPSYAASMQDYQNQVMPAEQGASPGYRNSIQNGRSSPASSPPPSYRSRTSTAHSGIYTAFPNIYDVDHPNSRPPTYRSRAPSRRPSFPHEYGVDLGIHEDETVTSLPYVSYLESSTIYISPSIAQTLETAVLSETSTPSNIPITGSPVTEAWSESLSPLEQSISLTSQIQTSNSDQNTSTSDQNTSTSDRNTSTSNQNIETDNKNASDLLHGAQNIISDSSVSSTEQRSGIDASQNDARPPSLHQRMLSEDRHILEQTLQSLEHMIESSGISNEGAVFDEQEHITDFQ